MAISALIRRSEWPTRADLVATCITIAVLSMLTGAAAMFYALNMRAKNLALTHRRESHQPNSTQLADLTVAGRQRPGSPSGAPPSDESTNGLISALEDLGSMIQKHVEDNYHLHETQDNRDRVFEALSNISSSLLKHDAQSLTDLCVAPTTRHEALRHVIAAAVFSVIDFSVFNEHVLLPLPVVLFWEALPRPHKTRRNAEGFHEWQRLFILLLQKDDYTPNEQALQPPEIIQSQVLKLRDLLGLVLVNVVPADHGQKYKRREQLEELIWAGARFGYRLLSQPGRWSFNWHVDARELVLVPGLMRLSDGHGKKLEQPETVGAVVAVGV